MLYLLFFLSLQTLYDKGDRPNINGGGGGKSLSDEEKVSCYHFIFFHTLTMIPVTYDVSDNFKIF